MNHAEFNAVLERQIDHMRASLASKGDEYANKNEDRFTNFKRSAALTVGETPEQALWGMLKKHIVSISDMVESDEHYSETMWDEKIGDAINYLVLLRGVVFERAQQLSDQLEADMPQEMTHDQFQEAIKFNTEQIARNQRLQNFNINV